VTTLVISPEAVAKALFDPDVAGGLFDREFLEVGSGVTLAPPPNPTMALVNLMRF